MIVTVCGSITLKKEIETTARTFSLEGKIAMTPVFSNEPLNPYQVNTVIQLHRDKIKMSDLVIIVTKDGKIGPHTQAEVDYATELKKPIWYIRV